MSIFSRRRLQDMLDAIGPIMTGAQAGDLFARLTHSDVTPALAAEVELGLLWAISQVTDIDLHPELTSKQKPEAFCSNLFPSGPAYVEVTAISDDEFSDRDKMERAANIISQFADRVLKASSKNLYFQFMERSGYETGNYRRRRRVTLNFELTPEIERALTVWLRKPDWPNPQHVRLTNDEIDVIIQWKKYVHPEGRTFCSMPPIAYDIKENPVYRRLEKKRSQLSGVPEGSLRCIFIGDAGCNILRDLKPLNQGNHAISGEKIIWHFLNKSKINLVAVFSPQRENIYNPFSSPLIWRMTIFDNRDSPSAKEHDLLHALARKLPRPNYEGYQARSLYRQGLFSPQARGQYLGTYMHVEDIKKHESGDQVSSAPVSRACCW